MSTLYVPLTAPPPLNSTRAISLRTLKDTLLAAGLQLTLSQAYKLLIGQPGFNGGVSTNEAEEFDYVKWWWAQPSIVLTSISPTTDPHGGSGFTLTVNDSGTFVSGDVILFGGTALATTFVNSTQMTGAVTTALQANAGTFQVQVQSADGLLKSIQLPFVLT